MRLPNGHSADALVEAITPGARGDPPRRRECTLTWDQGSKKARHDLVAAPFVQGVYFAEPGNPWQRPTNENTNGLLRQFFPTGSDLSVYTLQDLQRAEHLLNHRPRRVLDWKTPAAVFTAGLT